MIDLLDRSVAARAKAPSELLHVDAVRCTAVG
jgi:hypothetical protein